MGLCMHSLRNGVMCIAVVDLDGRLKQPLLRATVAQGKRIQSSAAPRVLKGVDAVAQQVGCGEQQQNEGASQHLHGLEVGQKDGFDGNVLGKLQH